MLLINRIRRAYLWFNPVWPETRIAGYPLAAWLGKPDKGADPSATDALPHPDLAAWEGCWAGDVMASMTCADARLRQAILYDTVGLEAAEYIDLTCLMIGMLIRPDQWGRLAALEDRRLRCLCRIESSLNHCRIWRAADSQAICLGGDYPNTNQVQRVVYCNRQQQSVTVCWHHPVAAPTSPAAPAP